MKEVTPKSLAPKCDFCKDLAKFDTQTKYGVWAYVCDKHFNTYATQTPGTWTRLEPVGPVVKECYLCGTEKPISEYYKYIDKKGIERFRSECIECNLAERKKVSFRKNK